MKCNCGKVYRQTDYNGKLPKYCADCGYNLYGDSEDYLNVAYSDDYHASQKFIFITGRFCGNTVDFRFDTDTFDVYEFPEHKVDLTGMAFLKIFLTLYAEGRIKIFGEYMR